MSQVFKLYSIYTLEQMFLLPSYLFIFGCTGSLLLFQGFLSLGRVGATLAAAGRPPGQVASRCGAQALGAEASVVAASGLSGCGSGAPEHGHSSCDAQA